MSCFTAFSFIGDVCHVLSILLLLRRLHATRNAQGISLRTQELYLLVFVSRYINLPVAFHGLYRGLFALSPLAAYILFLKVFLLSSTAGIVYAIRWKEPICSTCDLVQDDFRHVEFAILPCFLVATLNHIYSRQGDGLGSLSNVQMLLWDFSVCLEAVAILPQLYLLRRYNSVENLTGNYVFFNGAYSLFYGLSWVYKAYYEVGYRHNYLMEACGGLQVVLYGEFFYYWFKSKKSGRALKYGEGGETEYYDCDVKELRGHVNSSPLIDKSDIRRRGKSVSNVSVETGVSIGEGGYLLVV